MISWVQIEVCLSVFVVIVYKLLPDRTSLSETEVTTSRNEQHNDEKPSPEYCLTDDCLASTYSKRERHPAVGCNHKTLRGPELRVLR